MRKYLTFFDMSSIIHIYFNVRRKKDVVWFCYDNDVHVHVYDAHFLSCIKSHGNFLLYLQRKAERFSAFLVLLYLKEKCP